eukprot:TRINITY_DN4_c0_g2_i1.p1 TRINITY_DN4_c0_g2~~TRINITY_DN4_c0_g2_i1.p1  ORF type:complete len:149 (-),score=42.45 TRINITY_DN4_c0_g2_i1:164-559(-)
MKLAIIALFCLLAIAAAEVVVLTDANFEEVTAEGNYFVKFYAPWCGHCKKLAPTWDELAEQAAGDDADYAVAKVDCTENKQVCGDHGIRGYPSLYFFTAGERTDERYAGPRTLSALNDYAVAAAKLSKEDL